MAINNICQVLEYKKYNKKKYLLLVNVNLSSQLEQLVTSVSGTQTGFVVPGQFIYIIVVHFIKTKF